MRNPPATKVFATATLGWGVFLCLLIPQISFAAIIHSYTGVEWDTLCSSPSLTGNGFIFTNAGTQAVYNCGANTSIIDLSNNGAGQVVYFTATIIHNSGTFNLVCGGSVSNCTPVNFSTTLHEQAMTVPYQGGMGGFAYVFFNNNGGSGDGTITNVCVDDDGTSCTSMGGGGVIIQTTDQTNTNLSGIIFALAILIFLLSVPFWSRIVNGFYGGDDLTRTRL